MLYFGTGIRSAKNKNIFFGIGIRQIILIINIYGNINRISRNKLFSKQNRYQSKLVHLFCTNKLEFYDYSQILGPVRTIATKYL